jgi:hypothetical protein
MGGLDIDEIDLRTHPAEIEESGIDEVSLQNHPTKIRGSSPPLPVVVENDIARFQATVTAALVVYDEMPFGISNPNAITSFAAD